MKTAYVLAFTPHSLWFDLFILVYCLFSLLLRRLSLVYNYYLASRLGKLTFLQMRLAHIR